MTDIVTMLTPATSAKGQGKADVVFRVQAQTEEGLRKQATVSAEFGEAKLSCWAIRCDEGAFFGGEDSAPPPLAYFTAGIAFCLLTQISRLAEIKKVRVDDVRVDQSVSFMRDGSMLAGTVDTGVRSVDVVIEVDSDEPRERIEELIRVGTASCFAHAALVQPVAVSTTLVVNGKQRSGSDSELVRERLRGPSNYALRRRPPERA